MATDELDDYVCIDMDIEGLEKPRNPRQTPVRKLQALLWVTYTLQQSGLRPEEFSKKYIGNKSNLFYKWTRGETCPGERLVERIDSQLEGAGVQEIYDLPLFPLLEMRRLKLGTVKQLISKYCDYDRLSYPWRFPKKGDPCFFVPRRSDRRRLFELNDLYGFIALLGLFREALATHVICDQVYSCAFLYRALPAVARLPWVNPHQHLLFECLESLRMSCFATAHSLEIDWDVIHKQIEIDAFKGRAVIGPYDLETQSYEGLDDPIHYKIDGIHRWVD